MKRMLTMFLTVGAALTLLSVPHADAQSKAGKGQGLRLRDGSCATGTQTPGQTTGQRAGQLRGYGDGTGTRPQDGTGFGPGDGTRPRPMDGSGFGNGAQRN